MVSLLSEKFNLFALLEADGPVALAVSGGGDSMALMHLFALWRHNHPAKASTEMGEKGEQAPDRFRDVVFSVDHGLREEAAGEVAFVMEAAADLGFRTMALSLKDFEKGSAIQARAREGRYKIMAEAMAGLNIGQLLTAHTIDDQAETFLMRLKRGSGVDGLSAILPRRSIFGIELVRPLLSVSGEELRDFLKARSVSWIEDPTNQSLDYERVRMREMLALVDADGELRNGISKSVLRLQRARFDFETQTVQFLNDHACAHLSGIVEVALSAFEAAPFEVQVRVLRRLLTAFGRDDPGLSSLEGGVSHLLDMGFEKFALGGVIFEKRSQDTTCSQSGSRSVGLEKLVLSRETKRAPLEAITFGADHIIASGNEKASADETVSVHVIMVWDNRVGFLGLEALEGPFVIRVFQQAEIDVIGQFFKDKSGSGLSIPLEVLLSVAGFWRGGQLFAVPQLSCDNEAVLLSLFGSGEDCGGASDQGISQINALFPLTGWNELQFNV